MSNKTYAAIKRFSKVLLASVLPVLLSALSAETFEWRPLAIALATAAILAAQKYLSWTEPLEVK